MRYHRAGPVSALPPGGRLALAIDGRAVAIFNIDGRLFAIEDRCGHQFVPLSDGTLAGTRLTCRWHGWTYELDRSKQGELWPRATCFDVKVDGGEVYVGLPDAADCNRPGSCPGASIQ